MSVNIKENDALNGIAKLIPASNITLSSLPDTNITLPQAEQSLGYDEASGRWINYNVRISVYYSDDFRGLNISCTKGQTTITKTAPMDGNAVVFYVNEKGTWTVSSEIGATSYTDTVVVTSFGVTYPAQLVTSSSQTPEGATVEPTDDIQTWLACANLDKPYTTLDAVLADRETFETLIADSNACDYMARSTTWANDVADDADAMALIGKYDYCSNALLGNATWASAIANSDYWDSVLQPLVPTMTSNTTPSGEVSATSAMSGYEAYKAFDNNTSTAWIASSGSSGFDMSLTYQFANAVCAKVAKVLVYHDGNAHAKNYSIEVSNDGSTYTALTSGVFENITTTQTVDLSSNTTEYQYYRLRITSMYASANVAITELQYYDTTVQTNVVHSCANDTIYYMEDGSPVIVATTNSDGDGVLDFSSLEDKEYTFYSSVAKNPSNLSNDYSKTIRITKSEFGGTSEMYLMPDNDNMLYWFGLEYKPISFDRNGNGGYVNKNTNNISIGHYLSTTGNVATVYVTDKQILSNKVKAIISYGDTSSYFQNLGVTTNIAQTFGGATFPIQTSITPKTAMDVYEVDTSSQIGNNFYVGYSTNCYPSATYIHAMWLE